MGNTKREDIVFISFQFWVLGMSVVALLNESIPHIFASLTTHIMATAWGGFQLVHTAIFRRDYNTLITNGACRGVSSKLPIALNYWQTRREAEISSLTLNVLALVVSGFLSWRLFKVRYLGIISRSCAYTTISSLGGKLSSASVHPLSSTGCTCLSLPCPLLFN